jgi:hypothetical protein
LRFWAIVGVLPADPALVPKHLGGLAVGAGEVLGLLEFRAISAGGN